MRRLAAVTASQQAGAACVVSCVPPNGRLIRVTAPSLQQYPSNQSDHCASGSCIHTTFHGMTCVTCVFPRVRLPPPLDRYEAYSQRLVAALTQAPGCPVPLEELVVVLYAVQVGGGCY